MRRRRVKEHVSAIGEQVKKGLTEPGEETAHAANFIMRFLDQTCNRTYQQFFSTYSEAMFSKVRPPIPTKTLPAAAELSSREPRGV